MLLVKKYPNRRLYDTRHSRYITLEDLEKTVRGGEDVIVQDAQDGRDLTQETLTQIILERGNGKILPAALLQRLIRLDDAALGEFLTRYVSWALDLYVQARKRARTFFPMNPLATAPFAATDALAQMLLNHSPYRDRAREGQLPHLADEVPPMPAPLEVEPEPEPEPAPPAAAPATAAGPSMSEQVERLQRDLEALRTSIAATQKPKRRPKAAKKRRS